MSKRLELHEILCEIINITESDGDRHVYFQAPASVKMKYPAIRYNRRPKKAIHADNIIYRHLNSYELTLIDKNPDSKYIEQILELPYCAHDAHYKADNLNHDTFILYY